MSACFQPETLARNPWGKRPACRVSFRKMAARATRAVLARASGFVVAFFVTAAVSICEAGDFEKRVAPFFRQHCVRCHGPETQEGKLRLDTLAPRFDNSRAAAHWGEVRNRLNLGEMPPPDETQPDVGDTAFVAQWIARELKASTASGRSSTGNTAMRRLSRTEYANTVRDLLGVEFVAGQSPLDLLPPDGKVSGFDKVGQSLLLDASVLNSYVQMAELVANRAVRTQPPAVQTHRTRFEFENMAFPDPHVVEGGYLLMDNGGARSFDRLLHPFNQRQIPVRGRYTIRVRAGAERGERGEPVFMKVTREGDRPRAMFQVNSPIDRPRVYEFTDIFNPSQSGEIMVWFTNGTQWNEVNRIERNFVQQVQQASARGDTATARRLSSRLRAEGLISFERPSQKRLQPDKLPKLFLDWIEVEGPLHGPWPPKSMGIIFPDGLRDDNQTIEAAHTIFRRLLPRAYRRPLRPGELDRILRVVAGEMKQGEPFEEAVKAGLATMLCSPSILYLFEPANAEGEAARSLNDYEFAARLSYFLWSSMPDDELFRRAHDGSLRQRDVLDRQIDRMLADPRSDALVNDFARQWLKIDEFDRFAPDEGLYAMFYDERFFGIADDLKQEPLMVFRELLRKDDSVLSLLDSDWTMLNERLATWYGIEGVAGDEFRRVRLPDDSPRGGLVSMAGVHWWGSDGNRTKPVDRGKYILDVLFNDPPDPPPPNAGEVEPNLAGQQLTVRERLLKHQQVAICAACHRRIDPYGLALENFNAIGLWRDRQDGENASWNTNAPRIDASGRLPNGRRFGDVREFKRELATQRERLPQGLLEKLMTYAIGRAAQPQDAVDTMVATIRPDEESLRRLIKKVIAAEAFAGR